MKIRRNLNIFFDNVIRINKLDNFVVKIYNCDDVFGILEFEEGQIAKTIYKIDENTYVWDETSGYRKEVDRSVIDFIFKRHYNEDLQDE